MARRKRAHPKGEPQTAVSVTSSKALAARVVAIGASAGGLDALIELFSTIPADTGLAFVVIQHLDPRHASMLASILTDAATIPVQEVVDGMPIEPDHVYVIPPDREMTVQRGILRLTPRTPRAPHRPLDRFFRSLAIDQGSSAIGVVLSGNDADGALGLQAIHDAGGVTFAQTAETAKFDIMPRAAAEAADFVMSPHDIAQRLTRIGDETIGASAPAGEPEQATFDRIFNLLQTHHPVDFGHFKRGTIERRIRRRVLLGNFDSLSSYADSLQRDDEQVETLYEDLLIGVTSFFREPTRFEALKTVVFPAILQNREPENTLRLWVAGCSTGEEVYSLAMALLEFLDGRTGAPGIVIYGTDINEKSLKKARAAVYSQHAVRGVSPERLARFFTAAPGGGFKIVKEVRDLCVFATHDVTRDAPFSRIDLLTCCNVLIYFGLELQKKTVALLHYALAPGGFLMLGSSENLRDGASQLTPVSTKPLIYRKRGSHGATPSLDVTPRSPHAGLIAGAAKDARDKQPVVADDDDRFLSAQLAPCGVLINDRMEITRIRGDIAPFVVLEPGEVSFNLFRLVRHDEVLAELRPAVKRAIRKHEPVKSESILVLDGNLRRRVTFEVLPFGKGPEYDQWWVLFHTAPAGTGRKAPSARERSEIAGLRHALAAAIEDREHLADDGAAAAEEAQSSDEELRSTNEELETAKEELQSANEELATLNEELRSRNTSLVRMNDDIENLLTAVEIPILFVGADLAVRRCNSAAGRLLNLRTGAAGQPLREAKSSLDVAHLEKLVGAVIETGTPADVEVQTQRGDWRLLRIRVYRTSGGEIDGAIVAVQDINMFKRSVLVAEEATRRAIMLSQASSLLASSLDYETTLGSLARLSTAAFCDWCSVDLVNEDGSIRHLTVSHVNPVMQDLALQFQQAAFKEPEHAPGAPQALRLRKSVLLTDIAEWKSTGVQPEPKITQLIDALGVRSLISVPLVVRDTVLGTTTFSSSRRRYEATDLQFAEELSQRAAVALDTAMLFREAENANHYKEAFLGTIAHELRTPLTSILGWTQLAAKAPDMSSEALAQIEQAANLLRVFTEDLLDVARIREQKLRMRMGSVDLVTVIRSAIEIVASTVEAHRVQIQSRFELESAPMRGDSVRLLQVVWNLLTNAIKFTPAGGSVEIRLERAGTDARLSVIDTGRGISAALLPHVFELYRQGDGDAPAGSPGLGIGLSIVAQIVKLHGGTVRAESRGLGLGSTFIVTLPMANAPRKARGAGSPAKAT